MFSNADKFHTYDKIALYQSCNMYQKEQAEDTITEHEDTEKLFLP